MSTVAEVITRLPVLFQKRYDTQFVEWVNDLLEELSGEGFMMPSIHQEVGAVVSNDIWVTKPAGLREIRRIFNPSNVDQLYGWVEANDKIKLTDVEVDAEDTPQTVTGLIVAYSTTGITFTLAGVEEDEFAEYLLVITAGTYAGKTYIVHSNTASGAIGYPTWVQLTFENELSAALDGTKITAGYLAGPTHYVMINGSFSFDTVSTTSDEIPIDNRWERRLTEAWLVWKCHKQVQQFNQDTLAARAFFDNVLLKVKNERFSSSNRIQPRYSPGFDMLKSGYGNTTLDGRTVI